ncbi:MAG: metallophosphoesterase, partial [Planctomycetes bacterium]|nr:metallophosphoesterase [Planctomycetota bacterium]
MLELVALVPGASPTAVPEITLVSRGFPPHRHSLHTQAESAAKLLAGEPQYPQVPKDIPRQTYDLEIRFAGVTLTARHAVAIGEVGQRVRIVHLSDMNVGDIGAPDFDARLIDEINLVSPTLVVATGDYLDAGAGESDSGWQRLSDYFAKLEAPVLMACGDRDDIAWFSRVAAPSAIGTIQVGRYRGIIMMDHSGHPIERDAQQIDWVENLLDDAGDTFLVSHNESPGLARHWLVSGMLERRLTGGGVLAWFSGGHRDWDEDEYRRRARTAPRTVFVRTHQASSAALEGALGISHYSIVDFVDGRVVLPQEHGPSAASAPPSIAAGRINAVFHTSNDGSARQVALTVTNNLPYPVDHLSLRVLVRRDDARPPWCRGAELSQIVSFGRLWECRVTFDLPDRGARRIVIGTGEPPPVDSIRVEFDLPTRVAFESRVTDEGVPYQSSAVEPLVFISQPGEEAIEVMPRFRLDGSTIAYRPIDADGPFATAYRLSLKPDEIVALQLDFSALRVRPGRRSLQVYFTHRQAWAPVTQPFVIAVEPAARRRSDIIQAADVRP